MNNHAHVVRARPHFDHDFVRHYIEHLDLSPYVTGSAQPKLTQKALNDIRIVRPPLDEQEEIARRIERAFAWIDRLAAEATSARKLIDHLDQAILSKAFRGELVPQDPNDEPASMLLERIEAEGAVVKVKRRRRDSVISILS